MFGMFQSVEYGELRCNVADIPSRHSLLWKTMAARILAEYQCGINARRSIRLMVVHPKDTMLNAAVAALDLDDWNPEWPVPFHCRFESRNGGVWIIMQRMPELLLAN
jgi:hypothetical protein